VRRLPEWRSFAKLVTDLDIGENGMADIVGAFEAMDDGKDKLSEFLARHVTISSIKFYAFVTKMKKIPHSA
jgi:hypothetical protein